jgi:hypothetical protein
MPPTTIVDIGNRGASLERVIKRPGAGAATGEPLGADEGRHTRVVADLPVRGGTVKREAKSTRPRSHQSSTDIHEQFGQVRGATVEPFLRELVRWRSAVIGYGVSVKLHVPPLGEQYY